MEDNRVELRAQIVKVIKPCAKDHCPVTLSVRCKRALTPSEHVYDYHQLQLSRDFYQKNHLTISKARASGAQLYFTGYLRSVNRVDSLGRIFSGSQVVVSHILPSSGLCEL